VRIEAPYGDGAWRLYNIAQDPGETTDLSLVNGTLFEQMKAAYQDYAKANDVLEMPAGYQVQKQVAHNALKRQISLYGWKVALVLLGITLIIWLIVRSRRRPIKELISEM
jgi:hypothetical protein